MAGRRLERRGEQLHVVIEQADVVLRSLDTPPTDGGTTSTLAPVFRAIAFGVFRSKYGSTMMTRMPWRFISSMSAAVCAGDGGIPGFGST